ncbi:MAG: hypothetical protein JO352_03880 [Chloroflexi bacterium]|nr:hypothetical protein [Chloroflexota bacterium]MBV9482868.1 hypothetical protein [Acidobacteriota bacterium]
MGLCYLTGAAGHSLVLKNDGTVWAWGGNWFGELGNGTTTNSTTPVQATGLTGQTLIAAGRDHSMSATGSRLATTTYAYDKLYRLTGAAGPSGTTTYSYDPTGNRLSKVLGGNSTSYTYDKADRILTAGSTSYTVNAAGNVTARGSDAFGFDQANRLTSATTSTGSGTYAYDGDGKRVSKTVAGATTSYVYDVGGGLPVLLDDGTQKYVWGASGLAESVNKTSSAVAVYHTDGLSSVRALSDSTGNVTQTYQTDEFGIPVASGTQGSATQPLGYTGEQADPENGFVYLRARMYDPNTGRFMQRDPFPGNILNPSSLHRSTYAQNNPSSFADTSGLSPSQNNVLADHTILSASECPPGILCPPVPLPFPRVSIDWRTIAAALAAALTGAAPDQRSDRVGVYYRLESRTQTVETAALQQATGEIWGNIPQGGVFPAVQAYVGPLPPGARGIEFITTIQPDPGSPPGQAYWRGPRPGVRIVGDTAVLGPVIVTRNTQTIE